MKSKIIIIDGNSLINRAFFAMPKTLKSLNGTPTNAVFGFLKMVNKLIHEYKPTHMSVAFDVKRKTFRHEVYKDYKGTRKGMVDELRVQMPILKEILDILKIHRMELAGYEADDLIGTVAKMYSSDDVEVMVVTGDKDALQLVDKNVHVYITKKGISNMVDYTEEVIYEEFGISPKQIIDFKGLSGDSSDNIPGIPSVGPKTATKLLQEFETVENLIQNFEDISNKRIRGLVEEYAEQAILSKQLATIMTQVPIELDMDEMVLTTPDLKKLESTFMKYNFKNLIADFIPNADDGDIQIIGETIDNDFELVELKSKSDIDKFYKEILKVKKVAYLFIYDKQDVRNMKPQFLFLTYSDKRGYFVEFGESLKLEDVRQIFEDKEIKKIGYETKQDFMILRNANISMNNLYFDGYIASYLVHPDWKNYSISDAVAEYFNKRILTTEELIGKGAKQKKFSEIDREDILAYSKANLFSIYKISDILIQKLNDEGLYKLYYDIELPLIEVLADIEYDGFNVDLDILSKIDEELTQKIERLEKQIYSYTETEFNIKSPKQLGVVLFEELGLPVIKKTKTGYSTGHDILMKLKDSHPIIELIIEYRAYTKLKSTYVDGLFAVVNKQTGRIHTSLNQTVAVTGRLSSTEPNLQNIPIRLPLGREIRKIFVPSEGCKLIDADYSQIELRILAHMSDDDNMKKAFIEGIDVHSMTASQVFDVKLEDVTPLLRSRAKEVNFGIVYGMSDFGLSENLGIPIYEAKKYIEQYFTKYSKVKQFMDDTISECEKDEYVSTLFDRKRSIPEINHKNFNIRGFAKRTAMNTPIQGSAADIIKIAMIKVHNELKRGGYKSKLILQVHDELIIDTVPEEIEEVKRIIVENMESATRLNVPLSVDVHVGDSWYETK